MSFPDSLTPKNTEEIRPGLFIQRRGSKYRKVEPFAWNGKVRWKEQLRTIISVRFFFTVGLVAFLAFSYVNDNSQLLDFYNVVHEDPIGFCRQVEADLNKNLCTALLQGYGLCSVESIDGEIKNPQGLFNFSG